MRDTSTDALIAELQTYSRDLADIDRHEWHGIMTSVRFETIDVVGRACTQLDRLQRELATARRDRSAFRVLCSATGYGWHGAYLRGAMTRSNGTAND